jgi:uncharacterized protein
MDLLTSDAGRAREFYSGVFGWTAGEASEEFGGYFMFLRDGVPVAGAMPKVTGVPGLEGPDLWGVYLSTGDAKSVVEQSLARGAKVLQGPLDIADLGTEAVIETAAGERIGAWQSRGFGGTGTFGQFGTPGYFELLSRDYQGALAFYHDVFGWQGKVAGDTDEFRLTVITDGEDPIAGIMDATAFLQDGEQDHWNVYLKVADTNATLAKIVELGGTVVLPAWDTPHGKLAEAADPTGACFKLIG